MRRILFALISAAGISAFPHKSLNPSTSGKINFAFPLRCSETVDITLLWKNWESRKIYKMETKCKKEDASKVFYGNLPSGTWELYSFHLISMTVGTGSGAHGYWTIYKPEEDLSFKITLDSSKLNLSDRIVFDFPGNGLFSISLEGTTGTDVNFLDPKLTGTIVPCKFDSSVPAPVSGNLVARRN